MYIKRTHYGNGISGQRIPGGSEFGSDGIARWQAIVYCKPERGFPDAQRVPGPDLMIRIFKESREKGYRHYFYGSTEKTLEMLKKRLLDGYPWLNIAGMYSPPFRQLTDNEDLEIVKQINAAEPDFIWVALGAPKQEKWMYQHKNKLNGVMLGVGAAFDFSAGTVKRAPKWMQECCLEWMYRILQDPVRLIPRYFTTNFTFLWLSGKESFTTRKARKKKRIAMIGHKRIPSGRAVLKLL